mmetsp:Transcript_16116/g.48561  ORF Transcript_16116/g.48561 Transcript_16116/m.48561 type:complete len:221 (-) Transcript_16116:158-820(-)
MRFRFHSKRQCPLGIVLYDRQLSCGIASSAGMASVLLLSLSRCRRGCNQCRFTMQCASMKTMTGALASSTPLNLARISPCRLRSVMTFTLDDMAVSSFLLSSLLPSEMKMISSIRASGVKWRRACMVSRMCSQASASQGMTMDTLRSEKSSVISLQPEGRVSGGMAKLLGMRPFPRCAFRAFASCFGMHRFSHHAQSPLHQVAPLPWGQLSQSAAVWPPQ